MRRNLMALLDSTLNRSHALEIFDHALRARAQSISKRLASYRQYRAVRSELLQYSHQELRELGISDADIDRVARAAVGDVQSKD
jgi:uncharacterized protein YjiS (DUF1127 family)